MFPITLRCHASLTKEPYPHLVRSEGETVISLQRNRPGYRQGSQMAESAMMTSPPSVMGGLVIKVSS